MRHIGVVTVSRSDYGIYKPVLRQIAEESELSLKLYVSGMHLSPQFGMTVDEVREDGWEIAEEVEMLVASDVPEAVGRSLGQGAIGFSRSFARWSPDVLLLLGDRFEMLAAALGALPFKLPMAHIHGGELTEGAIDESIRHAITKMSHLHFVATEDAAKRVIQLGEEPWRVTVSGAPGLDNIQDEQLLEQGELEADLGVCLEGKILVTYHPTTLESESTEVQVSNLLEAIAAIDVGVVFTYPNADVGHRVIIEKIERFVLDDGRHVLVKNLGSCTYLSALRSITAMVGNSSSGIIEAASFKLPVVNIGKRQQGRQSAANVIHCGYEAADIAASIRKAISSEFRSSLDCLANPYGDGHASARIVSVLKEITVEDQLVVKRFHDLPVA